MPLLDFEIRKEPVTYQGKVTEVRGIALFDITTLVRHHLADMNKLFDMYDKPEQRNLALAQTAEFALRIVDEVPDLVAALIIRACDEDESDEKVVAHVRRLPIGLQVELVRKIIELTVEDAGGAKKLFDNLVKMMRTVTPETETLTTA